jgi:phosphoribosylanthranilate isomerase
MTDPAGPPDLLAHRPKVKICGLTRREDVLMAEEEGADFLGVVLVPETPRFLVPEEGGKITAGLSIPVVAVMADPSVAEAVSAAQAAGAGVIQLHGNETPDTLARIREAGPWTVWKALRVKDPEDVEAGLKRFGSVAHGLLLDAWHPSRKGGTGQVFSWRGVAGAAIPFPPNLTRIVAGGLNSDNVGDAVDLLRPHVVDVSSGVEKGPGVKDRRMVKAFIGRVRMAGKGEAS